MKKLLALALVCLLTLSLTAHAATNAAALLRRGDANAYEGDLRGLAAADGTLYILAGDALYTLAAGGSAPARQMLALEEETLEAGVTRR